MFQPLGKFQIPKTTETFFVISPFPVHAFVDAFDSNLLPGKAVQGEPLTHFPCRGAQEPIGQYLGCALCRAGYKSGFLVRECSHHLRPQGKACGQVPQGTGCFSHQEAVLGDLASCKTRYPLPRHEAPLLGTSKSTYTCCVV